MHDDDFQRKQRYRQRERDFDNDRSVRPGEEFGGYANSWPEQEPERQWSRGRSQRHHESGEGFNAQDDYGGYAGGRGGRARGGYGGQGPQDDYRTYMGRIRYGAEQSYDDDRRDTGFGGDGEYGRDRHYGGRGRYGTGEGQSGPMGGYERGRRFASPGGRSENWEAGFESSARRTMPKGYQRSDERIQEDVCERLSYSGMDVSDVSVQVSDRHVSLEGSVTDRRIKHAIENIAADCMGVQDVQNHIRVQRNIQNQRDDVSTNEGTLTKNES